MVHEDLDIQVCPIVAVHRESARLRQGINDSRMSVVSAASLNTPEAKLAACLQRVTVQDDLIYGTVVVVKSRQGSYRAIYHRAVKTGSSPCDYAISERLHLLLHL